MSVPADINAAPRSVRYAKAPESTSEMPTEVCRSSNDGSRGPDVHTRSTTFQPAPVATTVPVLVPGSPVRALRARATASGSGEGVGSGSTAQARGRRCGAVSIFLVAAWPAPSQACHMYQLATVRYGRQRPAEAQRA